MSWVGLNSTIRMFIINVTYTKSLDHIEKHLAMHRRFLEDGYQHNYFVVSGPKNPRTGGIIISQLNDRIELEKILNNDPFKIHDLAEYEIVEFTPSMFHADFVSFI